MSHKIVSVKGAAAMARANFWPYSERTHIGFMPTGEPIHAYCGAVIVDCRPDMNRLGR